MNSLPGLSRRYTQFPAGLQGRLAETPKRKLSIVIRGASAWEGRWRLAGAVGCVAYIFSASYPGPWVKKS